MNQLIIPAGFELVNFSWDRLPEILRSGSSLVKSAPAFFIAPRVAPAVRTLDRPAFEEDAERWDGLS
jgi:hypothetical protein